MKIYLADQIYSYDYASSFTFVPPSPGTYSGLIKVSNRPDSAEDLTVAPVTRISIYPNPFNPSTTIAFSTITTREVELSLYNLKGQKVRNLFQGKLNSGEHKLIWDGKDNNGRTVSSGIYFAKIQAGSSTQIRKMLLMK